MAKCWALIAVLAAGAPALAQEAPLDKVYACAAMTESAERLACYDAAVTGLKQAHVSGGLAIVTRAQLDAAEKEAFGLDQPSITQLARSGAAPPGAGGPKADLDNIALTIQMAERRPNGSYRFTMDNGQVWEQIDTYDLGRLPKGPLTAEIRKAAMNSFMLKPAGRTSVRVRRVK